MALWLWVLSGLVLSVWGQAPSSPCPEYFTYEQGNGQSYGYIRVPNVGNTVLVTISIASTTAMQGNVLQAVSGTRDYWISFQNQRHFPLINWIDINGQRVCTRRGGLPSGYSYTSQSTKGRSGPVSNIYSPLSNGIGTNDFYGREQYYGDGAAVDSPLDRREEWVSRGNFGGQLGSRLNTPQPSFWSDVEELFGADNPRLEPAPRQPPSAPRQPPPAPRQPPPAQRTTERPKETRPPQYAKSCGVTKMRTKIPLVHYGILTKRGEWPWLAAVYVNREDSIMPICGGSLVDLEHVVTAAHCVHHVRQTGIRRRHKEMYVQLGKYNLGNINENGSQHKEIRQIHVHEAYDHTTFMGDIALIELESPVDYTEFVRPICLWDREYSVAELRKSSAFVAGWGRDETGKQVTSMPMKAKATIVSLDECRESLRAPPLNEMSLCAGAVNGSGPCNGDSGGGLMIANPEDDGDGYALVRFYLTGVVSVGQKHRSNAESNGNCDLSKYVIYVNVNKYLDWLRQYIKEET